MATAFTKAGKEKLYSYFGIPKGTAVDDAERIINADPAKKMQYARFKSFATQMAKGKGVLTAYVGTQVTNRSGEYRSDISAADVAKAQALGVALPAGTKVTSKGHALGAITGNRMTAVQTSRDFAKAIADAELFAAQKANNDKARAEQEEAAAEPVEQVTVADPVAEDSGVAPVVNTGGNTVVPSTPPYVPSATIEGTTKQRMDNPALPDGTVQTATKIDVQDDQFVKEGTGQLADTTPAKTTKAEVSTVADPTKPELSTLDDVTKTVGKLPQAEAQTGVVDPRAVIDAQTQDTTQVSDLDAAQLDTAQTVKDAPTRTLEEGELIAKGNQGLSSVDQTKVDAAFGTGEIKAASVQDELTGLMAQFEDGQTPAWAAGGMRRAMAQISARGLGASSMAGQAIIQAAMESALPIAQIDASNKQQMALFKGEQRAKFLQIDFDQDFQAKVMNAAKVSEIANINFNAQQQIALENARMAQTVDLANLNNKQALVMAEAAQLSQLEMANLNNRQQAEVMNAQNFLTVDMKNLDNKQQAEIFNTQSRVQGMFNDQAAENAAKQFNAASENQLNQFFASLQTQVQQYNASAQTANSQFNAGQANSMEQFNKTMDNQRDQFNAQNQMVIAQGNVQWRRAIATGDTAAINRANELNANAMLGISNQAYQNLWQYFGDTAERTWKTAESTQDRLTQIAMTQLTADASIAAADKTRSANNSSAIGGWIAKLFGL